MDTTFGIENDLLYGMGTKEMFEAMGMKNVFEERKLELVAPIGQFAAEYI
jgi:hypothetical protein